MSQRIDREGLFRGAVLDSSLCATKDKGYPQVVLKVRADEFYDEAGGEWIPWGEYGMDALGYMCLVGTGKDGVQAPTFSYESVKEVFSWPGQSLPGLAKILAEAAANGVRCQFRMMEDDWVDRKKDGYKLKNIYVFDAPPTRELKQLDKTALDSMEAQFGVLFAASPTAAKPVSRKSGVVKKNLPKTKPLSPSADPKTKIAVNDEVNDHVARDAAERAAREEAKVAAREAKKAAKKTGPPPMSKKKDGEFSMPVDTCTQLEAWEALVKFREDNGLEEAAAETAYREAVFEVVGELQTEEDTEKITEAQWAEVRTAGMDKMALINEHDAA